MNRLGRKLPSPPKRNKAMSERDYYPATSEHLIRNAISSLNLTETARYSNSLQTVATCSLHTKKGDLVSEGAGKGLHCIVGALAESVEHYLMQQPHENALIATTTEIRKQPALALDGIIASLPAGHKKLDCVLMSDDLLAEPTKVPLILLQPEAVVSEKLTIDPELSFMARYSTNSGSAFGCSRNEAILHGLNEVIERHILSNLLMTLCGQHESMALYTLEPGTLEDAFSELPDFIPNAKEMKILFYKSLFGSFFSIAVPKRPQGRYPICLLGSGCSMDLGTSIRRSATELVQALELFDETERAQDEKAYELLDPCPSLRPLIKLDTLRNKIFNASPLFPADTLTVEDQISVITRRLNQTGFQVLSRCVKELPNGCAVTQVYIPGFERFNLIRSGLPVVPQRHLWSGRTASYGGSYRCSVSWWNRSKQGKHYSFLLHLW